MKPVATGGPDSFTLGPPRGQEADIDSLPAQRTMIGSTPGIATVWELDEAELFAICQRGARIRLTVLGTGHPPVMLEVIERER